MGTRADYYVGTGPTAEWLGSTTWDGYPDGTPAPIFEATTEAQFRGAVTNIIADADAGGTKPEEGWPWPWDDSRTTDYAYAWRDGGVLVSVFGRAWQTREEEDREDDRDHDRAPKLGDDEVVNMTARKASRETMLAKSGLIVIEGRKP